jgi:predicted LPLAT superfamily acyltransferase
VSDRRRGQELDPDRLPLVQGRDIGLVFSAPLAWILPQSLWHPMAVFLSSLSSRVSRGARENVARIAQVTRDYEDMPPPRELHVSETAGRFEQHLQDCRELRPGGWHPQIVLHGKEHVESALGSGRGAILWVAPFLYNPLVTKKALHEAGFAVTHLSRVTHGPSDSRFGVRFLNKLRIANEGRYVAERLAMGPGDELAFIRELKRRLNENGLVSITASPEGRRLVEQPFLGGVIAFATGAPSLAFATGAALLPVVTLRRGSKAFEVIVGRGLECSRENSRRDGVVELVRQFVGYVETLALQHPTSCLVWSSLHREESHQ